MQLAGGRPLRICSLLPSTTEIVGGLGLASCLCAVTHECDVAPDEAGLEAALAAGVLRVTAPSFDPQVVSQAEVDARVKASTASGAAPLFALDEDRLRLAAPSVVLTQTLCGVCAPALAQVQAACARLPAPPSVHAFEPHNLVGVTDSFQAVAAACGVPERGAALRAEFEVRLGAVRTAAAAAAAAATASVLAAGGPAPQPPTLLLLEWLDPPFDGGGWVPDLVRCAGARPVLQDAVGAASRGRAWADVRAVDPDVVVVACCGFDLARNLADARAALAGNGGGGGGGLASLRAWRLGRVFCADGNRYFSRPSQALAAGAALLARCVWGPAVGDDPSLAAFLPPEGRGWCRLLPATGDGDAPADAAGPARPAPACTVEDVEDLHRTAVAAGQMSYIDPSSGYTVFTELAHRQRGRCCGSGCRHCPYGHVNVRRGSGTVSGLPPVPPPALLAEPLGGLHPAGVHVLFWSTGKDSLLALRAIVRSLSAGAAVGGPTTAAFGGDGDPRRRVVLLTTHDAESGEVAHQGVSVAAALRQANHLGLALLAVPLPRGGGGGGGGGGDPAAAASFSYEGRVAAALAVLTARGVTVLSVSTGDLHLQEIRGWRERTLVGGGGGVGGCGALGGAPLLFPLWSAAAGDNYGALEADLEASGVPCAVSAVEGACAAACAAAGVPPPVVGDAFTPRLRAALQAAGCDGFGERGEFHTLAKVWEVGPGAALGL